MDGGGKGSPLGNPKCGNFGFCDWTVGRSVGVWNCIQSQSRPKESTLQKGKSGKREERRSFFVLNSSKNLTGPKEKG